MQVQVKTSAAVSRKGEPEVVMRCNLVPRGSGNRKAAEALARTFRGHPVVKPFIKRVGFTSSSVTVRFRACVGLAEAFAQVAAEERARQDVPGQLGLFSQVASG